MKKVTIAVWNEGGKGKSSSLRDFAHLLLRTYPLHTILSAYPTPLPTTTGDLRLVVEINGKVLAIETQGDPKTNLRGRLLDIATTYNPDIILCTTRTRGETVSAVEDLAAAPFSYETIWTSTYQSNMGPIHAFLNSLKAKHILDLLQSLGVI